MFPTSLSREYQIAHDELAVPVDRLVDMTLSTAEASWLPSDARARLRSQMEAEIADRRDERGVRWSTTDD